MKTASQIFEDMIENFELITKQVKALYPALESASKKVEAIYHTIETAKLNELEIDSMMVDLQLALQERRILKNELEALKKIKEAMPLMAHDNYAERKRICRSALNYYTNYEKDYFKNFSIVPEEIAVTI